MTASTISNATFVPATRSRRAVLGLLAVCFPIPVLAQVVPGTGAAVPLEFDGRVFVPRWSRNGQHEFTPDPETDLRRWTNMLTVNVHRSVVDGEGLARLANGILGNYRQNGRIMKALSKPARPDSPAEHMMTAVLGRPGLLEAAFTRVVLRRERGFALTYSFRIYQANAGPAMSEWLNANGNRVEASLAAWNDFARIEALPAG
jgi:hypothetical protein